MEDSTNQSLSCDIANNTLFIVELFADRLAHSLRSPLGVMKGFISDSLTGVPIDDSGLNDANYAIDKMLKIVDDIVSIAIVRRSPNALLCLSDVLNTLPTPLCSPVITLDSQDNVNSIDITLAQHAMYCLDVFIKSCLISNVGKHRPERRAKIERNGNRICWSLITTEILAIDRYKGCTRFHQVAALVNSPIALGLLVAESAMALNGLSSVVRVHKHGEMQLELIFDTEKGA